MKNVDVELIHRVLAGDEPAFSILVRKYQKQIHGLVWQKIGDFHLAEEITQDTFLKAYQKLATLKDPTRFSRWISVIANRCCIEWIRKKRIQTQPLEAREETVIQQDAYSSYVVEERERTIEASQREAVKKLLAKLSEDERTVITLHYFSEMTCEEIGDFLGVSTNTIKSRLRRAQQRLKREQLTIRETLSGFQLSPNLTENIMRALKETGVHIKPATPVVSKPWGTAALSTALIGLMLGIGYYFLASSQQFIHANSDTHLTVMTYDFSIWETDQVKVPAEVANMYYNKVRPADFEEHSATIAKSIKAAQPHVIALRGVPLILRQTPGDLSTGGQIRAEDVVLDFRNFLKGALLTEGLEYTVAASILNMDVEVAMFTADGSDDVRLTTFQLILTRNDVSVTRAFSSPYANSPPIENSEPGIESKIRGTYGGVDVTVSGTTYHVVSAELEALETETRVAQAQALLDVQLRDEPLPIILLVDLNTLTPDSNVYQFFQSEGYVDIWNVPSAEKEGAGVPCCQAELPQNPGNQLLKRINLVLVRNVKFLPSDVITHRVSLNPVPSDVLSSDVWQSHNSAVVVHVPVK